MLGKMVALLLISALITLIEATMLYWSRKHGQAPFKIRLMPDIEF